MPRPKKIGLDYYPKDTDSFNDRKVKRLLKAFGAKGYLIHEYLLSLIYSDKGYWIEWDENLRFDIADFLGDGISENLVGEVVNTSVNVGLFSVSKFDEFSVLTSNGIQRRYLSAKRGKVVIDSKIKVYVTEIEVCDAVTQITATKSTQSKVKKSKEEVGESINDLFDQFKKEVKDGQHATAIQQLYMSLKLKEGTLTPLVKQFQGHLLFEGKLHPNTKEFKFHFRNWLNRLDSEGKLKQYKRQWQN